MFADAPALEAADALPEQSRPAVDLLPMSLTENLRNTKQIAGTFSSLTPEQQRIRGLPGVPVRLVQCANEDAVEVADDEAAALLDADWPPEAVALLITHKRHPVQVERQAGGQDAYWASYWEDDDLFYGHVLGFKGLERPAVVLAVNGCRDVLVVCGDIELIRRVGGDGVVQRLTGR